MCGKNSQMRKRFDASIGSPPRVREKLARSGNCAAVEGITPACAGKTNTPAIMRGLYEDHPRVCGKNLYHLSSNSPLLGSPPRVREKRGIHDREKARIGITPACAGKTHFANV